MKYKNIKRLISLSIATTMITSTVALAAPGDFLNKGNNKYYKVSDGKQEVQDLLIEDILEDKDGKDDFYREDKDGNFVNIGTEYSTMQAALANFLIEEGIDLKDQDQVKRFIADNKSKVAIAVAEAQATVSASEEDLSEYEEVGKEKAELKVESVSAIDDIKLGKDDTKQLEPRALDAEGKRVEGVEYSFTSSNPEVATVSEGGLVTGVTEGSVSITVTTTNAVEEKSTTVDVTVVNELKDIEMKIVRELDADGNAKPLVADGKTVMEVEVTLNTPNVEQMGGMLEISSKLGISASKQEEALDKGKATFKMMLPTSIEELKDTVTVTVKSHDKVDGIENNELVGLTISQDVAYEAMGTEGGGEDQLSRSYTIDNVRSMDMADRVAIYVGMDNLVDEEAVKKSIIDQVKLYNTEDAFEEAKQIDIIKIEEVKKVEGGYAFVSLIDLGDGEGTTNVLHDNQYNYYSVEESTRDIGTNENKVSLNLKKITEDSKRSQRFMLIDGTRPEARSVRATKNDGKYLPNDSIIVEFNEPVNKLTAEDPSNWTINGKPLAGQVRDIILLDVEEAYDTDTDKKVLNWEAINEGKERNSVIIQLKPSFARQEIRNGQDNLLQIKSVADWAGMTDLTDNNKISTQDFTFTYDVPEIEAGLNLESQSPEQFILQLGDDLYTAADTATKFDFANATIAVTLEGKNRDGSNFKKTLTKDTDYKIRAVETDIEDNKYVLELTSDWTELLATETNDNAYHGKTFKVSIIGKTFDVYGEQVTGVELEAEDAEGNKLKSTVDASVVLLEDNVSPEIKAHKVLTAEVEDKKVVNGNIEIEMTEPVQLTDGAGNVVTSPGKTPTDDNFSEPIFEYVQIRDAQGKDLTSEGLRVSGEVVNGSVNEYDTTFTVKPSGDLEAGDWKLVVRGISDDVGNTMRTEEEITFTIEGQVIAQNIVNPYLVWGYVVDDHQLEDSDTEKDYVRLLFSREMNIDVLKSGTYSINGKKIDQDAKITDEFVELYDNTDGKLHSNKNKKVDGNVEQWMGHLVTIELPKDFIKSDLTTNALTLPSNLKAVSDGIDNTSDVLLGDTQYQLDFEGYADLSTGDKPLLPAFSANAKTDRTAAANKTEFMAGVVDSNDASISEVKVKDTVATVDGSDDTVYNVELATGTVLADLAATDVVVTATDANATVADAVKSDLGATWTVLVTAEDGTTTETYTINVTVASATNNAPTVANAISDTTGTVGGSVVTVAAASTFTDADSDALTITAVSGSTNIATVGMNVNGTDIEITPVAKGTATITVTANDGNGGTVDETFDIVVTEEALSLSDVSITGTADDSTTKVTVTNTDVVTAVSATEANATVEVEGALSEEATVKVTGVANGASEITVTVKNANGDVIASGTFTVTVSGN